MSCSSPARRRSRSCAAPKPSSRPMPTAYVGDAARMARGEGRLGVDHAAKASRCGRCGRRRPRRARRRRAAAATPLVARDRRQSGSESGDREERVGDRGVEPAPAALAHHLARGRRGRALGEEHLGRLRQAGDARQQRDRVAAQPEGLAAAVPVLVERSARHRRWRRGSSRLRDDRARRGRSASRRSPCPRGQSRERSAPTACAARAAMSSGPPRGRRIARDRGAGFVQSTSLPCASARCRRWRRARTCARPTTSSPRP